MISNRSKRVGEVLNARLTEFPGELVTDEVTACWSYQVPGTALRALPGPGTSTRVPGPGTSTRARGPGTSQFSFVHCTVSL